METLERTIKEVDAVNYFRSIHPKAIDVRVNKLGDRYIFVAGFDLDKIQNVSISAYDTLKTSFEIDGRFVVYSVVMLEEVLIGKICG